MKKGLNLPKKYNKECSKPKHVLVKLLNLRDKEINLQKSDQNKSISSREGKQKTRLQLLHLGLYFGYRDREGPKDLKTTRAMLKLF